MYNTVRHYSLISAISTAIMLAFSLLANAYAFSPTASQLTTSLSEDAGAGSGTNSLQQDKKNDENGNGNNHGNGNKQGSNQSGPNGQDDNKGNKGNGNSSDHANNGHGKKIKIKAVHDGGKVNVQEDQDDDNQNQLNEDNVKATSPESETFPVDFQLKADGGIAIERGTGNSAASSREDVSLNLNASTIRLEGNHVRVAVDGIINVGSTEYKISDGDGIIIFFNNPGKNFFRGIVHITGIASDAHGNDLKFHMRAFLIPTDDNNGDGTVWSFVVAPAAKLGPKIRIVSLVGQLSQPGSETSGGVPPPSSPGLDHFAVSTIPQSVQAGKLFNVTVTAKDKDDNTLKSYVGNARVSDKTGTVNPILLVDFKNGTNNSKMNITKATKSDMLTFTDVASGKIGNSNLFNVTAGSISRIQLDPSSVTVQPGHSVNFTATLTDNFENKISPSGKAFIWSVSPGLGTLSTSINKANFTAASSLTLQANATLTVRVNITSSAFVQDQSKITISPTAQQALDHFIVGTIPTKEIAGIPFQLNLTAVNSANNTVTNYAGTIVINDTTKTLQIVTNNGFSSGIWTGTVKITKASANVTITVRDNDSPSKTGSSNKFEVTAAEINKFTISHIAANQTAGKEFLFDLTALDEFGNVVKDYDAKVDLSTNDGSSPAGNDTKIPSSYTFIPASDKGKHTFNATLYNAKVNVTISVEGSGKVATSNKFTVQPSEVAEIIISPDSISLKIGENVTLTAEATDAYGNNIEPTDALFAWSLSSSSIGSLNSTEGSVVLFSATTDPITTPLSGSIIVTAGAIDASRSVTVNPA